MDQHGLPTVFRHRTPLSEEGGATLRARALGARYDTNRQMWITRDGVPLVQVIAGSPASDFGETIVTKTTEGVDQTEGAGIASDFGETIVTATREGVDQTESASPFEMEEDDRTRS